MRALFRKLIVVSCLVSSSQSIATPDMYRTKVGSKVITCQSWDGKPVRFAQNIAVDTIGRASMTPQGDPVVELNPVTLQGFSPVVAQFWVEHECAHHALQPRLNSERKADCLAAQRLRRRQGGLSNAEVAAFENEFAGLPGSTSGHLPGPERVKRLLKCAGQNPSVMA
jgi:hypothetical protein